MFKFMVIALIALGGFAFSETHISHNGYWKLISEVSEVATGPEEFIELQKKYPEYFAGHDPEFVTSAQVLIRNYKYKGHTSCLPNDSRLRHQYVEYGLCEEFEDTAMCFTTAGPTVPDNKDPCQ